MQQNWGNSPIIINHQEFIAIIINAANCHIGGRGAAEIISTVGM
jgi:hypothetical protein